MPTTTLRLHVGQGTHRGPLTTFPVWTDAPSARRRYVTGAAAPVGVSERTDSPAVDQLAVTNRGSHPVLLLAGEVLECGWQTRALTTTTVLAPRVQKTQLTAEVPAGLGRRLTGGGRIRVDDVRWHDRTIHLSAVLQEVS